MNMTNRQHNETIEALKLELNKLYLLIKVLHLRDLDKAKLEEEKREIKALIKELEVAYKSIKM